MRILVALILMSSLAAAQNDEYIISRTGSVSLQPEYQRWFVGGSRSFTQIGTTLSMYYPASRSTSFTLEAGQASYSGDLQSVAGLTDIQFSCTQYVENINALFSLGLGIPVGKKELTIAEFQTIALTSYWVFDLDHPGLGAGPTIEPGVSWLIPATDDLVFGLSGSFQYKGKYKPLAGVPEYDPGDEINVSGGVDIHISDQDNISADLTFTGYGADKFSDREIFQSGNSVSVIAQYLHDIGESEFQVIAGYRGKMKSRTLSLVGLGLSLVEEPSRIEPNRIDGSVEFLGVFSKKFSSRFAAGVRTYDKTVSPFSDATIYSLGVLPAYQISSSVSLKGSIQVEFGSVKDGTTVSGLHGGIGIATTF